MKSMSMKEESIADDDDYEFWDSVIINNNASK